MITFNILTGNFDFVGSSEAGAVEDGTVGLPYTSLNIKRCLENKFYLIKSDLESVVTRQQTIDGILIIDGVNTVL